MSDSFWREGFGPLLPHADFVPFGDLDALEQKLRHKRMAAFFVEPVQGEAGIQIPPAGYLRAAQQLCRRYGTLFVADEVYSSVYDSLKRSIVHTSTFGENGLAMRAGLATLDVLEREDLGRRATALGEDLRSRLRDALSSYEMIREIRGLGLMCGIEFSAPSRLSLRIPFEAFRGIHAGIFGQVLVMRLFRDSGILTQMCGNNFMVLKAAPPLTASPEHTGVFVEAMRSAVELAHSPGAFWSEGRGLARRAVNV